MARENFIANLIGESLVEGLPEEGIAEPPVRVGDEGILALYGDGEGVTVVVAAYNLADAERRIVATFGDAAFIDDLQESVDDRPLSVAYTAGRVGDEAYYILLHEQKVRPYLLSQIEQVEANIAKMSDATKATYRARGPYTALAALDDLIAGALARADAEPPRERRVLVARYDVTDLLDREVDALAAEASAQADRSDGHPSVEVEIETPATSPDAVERLRAAFERAHERSSLKLGDEDLDIYFEAVVRALGLEHLT